MKKNKPVISPLIIDNWILKISPHNGFTLAELLIVIAIITILAVLILLALNPFTYIKKAYDTERKADIHRIKSALEDYYSDHDSYPSNLAAILSACDGDGLAPYLQRIPCDPNTGRGYTSFITPVGSSAPQHYAVYAPTTSVNFPDANDYAQCPNTLIVHSTSMSDYDILKGCGQTPTCHIFYGCKSGACVIVAYEEAVSCSPSSCDSDCGAGDTPIETFCSRPNAECK